MSVKMPDEPGDDDPVSVRDYMNAVLELLVQQFSGAGVTVIVSRPDSQGDAEDSTALIASSATEDVVARVMREFVRNYDARRKLN